MAAPNRLPAPTFFLVVFAILVQPCQARSFDQFQQFFPAWSGILQDIIDANCSEVMAVYLDRKNPDNQAAYYVLGCIMEHFPEFRKAELAAAGVVLGLIPVTLQAVSVSTTEISILSLRRPFLAFFMAAGSPVLVPLRSRMHKEALEVLRQPAEVTVKGGWLNNPGTLVKAFISLTEYFVVLASAGNVATLVWQLSIWAVTVFAPRDIFMPSLWVYLAVLVHFGGVVALRLRISTPSPTEDNSNEEVGAWGKGWLWIRAWAISELTPCVYGKPLTVNFRKPNTALRFGFFAFSWATFCGANMHVLMGIITLSAVVFISHADTIGIIGRFIASAVLCRLVVMYELSGLREVTSGVMEVAEEPITPTVPATTLQHSGTMDDVIELIDTIPGPRVRTTL
jgi:hypothetical protein